MARACTVLVFALFVAGCDEAAVPAENPRENSVRAAPPVTSKAVEQTRETNACLARIRAARERLGEPSIPLDGVRAELLARAKGEPVVFVRPPRVPSEDTPEIAWWRARIFANKAPAYALYQQYGALRRRPDIARALLLREGYLYADSPGFGAALVAMVELHHLFNVPELVIQRGADEFVAVRSGDKYVYAGGARDGEVARLLLFDRVFAAGDKPGPALHRDLRALQAKLGFDRVRIERLGEDTALAELRYGTRWIPALLATRDTRLELECEATPRDARAHVEVMRDVFFRRMRALGELRRAVETMVGEALPFDEPKTEEGQQDGNLRPKWRFAYLQGWERYEFNDDKYTVFDNAGRPRVPQVCVDFITDSFERASGTWWRPRGEPRERLRGALDFDELAIDNRRSVERFVDFAERHPEWFEVDHLAWQERVAYQRRREFFDQLAAHADRYQPGDVVTIHGLRDDDEYHYHSFIVLEEDPITGVPTIVGANAGQPRIRPLASEMQSAPKRSLKTRVRPRLEWLEAIVPAAGVALRETTSGADSPGLPQTGGAPADEG